MVVATLLSWKFCPHYNITYPLGIYLLTEKEKNQREFERKEWWKKKVPSQRGANIILPLP